MKALVKFSFSLMDLDGGGYLDKREVRELIRMVYGEAGGRGAQNERVQQVIEEIDADGDGKIGFDEFQQWNKRFPGSPLSFLTYTASIIYLIMLPLCMYMHVYCSSTSSYAHRNAVPCLPNATEY